MELSPGPLHAQEFYPAFLNACAMSFHCFRYNSPCTAGRGPILAGWTLEPALFDACAVRIYWLPEHLSPHCWTHAPYAFTGWTDTQESADMETSMCRILRSLRYGKQHVVFMESHQMSISITFTGRQQPSP